MFFNCSNSTSTNDYWRRNCFPFRSTWVLPFLVEFELLQLRFPEFFRSLFVFLCFFLWSWRCLLFIELCPLITRLVYLNISCRSQIDHGSWYYIHITYNSTVLCIVHVLRYLTSFMTKRLVPKYGLVAVQPFQKVNLFVFIVNQKHNCV